MEEQDFCRPNEVATPELADRAQQFINHVAQVVSIAGDREAAFQAVFGYGGLYLRMFPTLDDRLALRDIPLGRAEAFRLVSSLSARLDPAVNVQHAPG